MSRLLLPAVLLRRQWGATLSSRARRQWSSRRVTRRANQSVYAYAVEYFPIHICSSIGAGGECPDRANESITAIPWDGGLLLDRPSWCRLARLVTDARVVGAHLSVFPQAMSLSHTHLQFEALAAMALEPGNLVCLSFFLLFRWVAGRYHRITGAEALMIYPCLLCHVSRAHVSGTGLAPHVSKARSRD